MHNVKHNALCSFFVIPARDAGSLYNDSAIPSVIRVAGTGSFMTAVPKGVIPVADADFHPRGCHSSA
ncbi:hypothetical protein [Wolbachia endosymbiont (group A) of Beris morrisii]